MIIIPDIHGRDFWKKPVEESLGKEHIIFLGDYLDPYDYEGIPQGEVFPRFEEIMTLKREHPEDVTLLLGNHDLHYLDGDLGGSRYDYFHGARNKNAFLDNADLFQLAFETEMNGKKYLFTHAGVLWGWLVYNKDILGITGPDAVCIRLNQMWKEGTLRSGLYKVLADIPASRWGSALYGSPIWNDVEDMSDDYEELPGYYQIFGHSQQETDPVIGKHFACLDCRKAFRLNGKGEITELL